jgi:hypothetical protein
MLIPLPRPSAFVAPLQQTDFTSSHRKGPGLHVELMKMHPPCSLRASQTFEGAGWSGEGTPTR